MAKVLISLLVLLLWLVTAVAAFFAGVIMEHDDSNVEHPTYLRR